MGVLIRIIGRSPEKKRRKLAYGEKKREKWGGRHREV